MTATAVNGLEVIASEPTPTPLNKPDRPVFHKRVETLMLSDGSTVFGCTECEYTSDKPGAVRGHLKTHAKPASGRSTNASEGTTALVLLAQEVESATAAHDRALEQVVEWRSRALTAERKLAKISRLASGE